MKFKDFLEQLGVDIDDADVPVITADYNIQVSDDDEVQRGWRIKEVEFDHANERIIIHEEEVEES